mmetsp:Transcript_57963/g.135041  ORF Transcript_57963/g.135041 Transcript_57963/m.135041 type:complete len:242 (-) Transcript_57963:95-820(-)
MEVGDLPASGHPDAHHSFPALVSRQHVHQLTLQLQPGGLDVELGVVVQVTAAELGKGCDRREVHVLLRCYEELHRHLHASEFSGKVLVPIIHWAQQFHLLVSPKKSGVVARRLEREIAHAGNAGTEHQELATLLLHREESAFHSRTQARLIDSCFCKEDRQGIEQRENRRLALANGHQHVVRPLLVHREKQVLEVRDHHHLWCCKIGTQVVEVQGCVKSHDAHVRALPSRYLASLDGLLDR